MRNTNFKIEVETLLLGFLIGAMTNNLIAFQQFHLPEPLELVAFVDLLHRAAKIFTKIQ
jgi:hypothetical protein